MKPSRQPRFNAPTLQCSRRGISSRRSQTKAEASERRRVNAVFVCCALICLALSASAQSYSINWYKIAGGGGTSSGGQYSVSGTIGQPDASPAMTGGNYSLTGGFWAFISVVQTPGAPTLHISQSGKTVTVYWQNVSGWTLQQNTGLTSTLGWGNYSGTPSLVNGTNYVNLTSPTGNLYFRLANP